MDMMRHKTRQSPGAVPRFRFQVPLDGKDADGKEGFMLNSIATIIAIAVAGGFCSVWLAVFMFCMKRGLIAVKASLTAGYRASKYDNIVIRKAK